jgi:hypothetical protein
MKDHCILGASVAAQQEFISPQEIPIDFDRLAA